MEGAKHAKVREVFRVIFPLLHGQAAVERGFLLNSKLMIENLQEKTLVASRFGYSTVKSDANHFNELSFTPRLKGNVQAARMRYQLCLKKQRKLHGKSGKAVEGEICKVECKKKLLNKSIQAMSLEADKSATEAKGNTFLLCFQNQILSD